MVKIGLYFSNSEDYVEINANNSKEFQEYLITKLKISHYNLLFDQGDKIGKKKMHKFDEILGKKYKDKDSLEILLITSDSISSNTTLTKYQEEVFKLNSIIEKAGLNSSYLNSNFKKILETVFFMMTEFKKFENQQKIIYFLNSFYKNMLDKIGKQLTSLNEAHDKFKQKKEELEFDDTFNNNLSEFKQIFSDIKNLSHDVKVIEKSFLDFCKFFSIFEDKLKSFITSYNTFKEKNMRKLKESNLHPIPESLKDIKEKINELFSELINANANLFSRGNSSPIVIKEILSRVENYWNKNNLSSYIELFSNFHKMRRTNSSKIRSMLDDECLKLKKGIIEKLSEINFFKKTLDDNLEIALLPQVFKMELTEIKNEIEKRREFDFVFQTITNFLNNNLLCKEESRRKEFSERIYKYCKNDIYKSMFNKIYEKFTVGSETVPEKLLNCIQLIEQNLNYVVDKLYYSNEEKGKEMNSLKDLKESVRVEKMEKDNEKPHIKKDPPLIGENFTQFLNEHMDNLNKLQLEVKKILKENFKINNSLDDNILSKQNSEAVLIDREELNDNNKFSPVINLENDIVPGGKLNSGNNINNEDKVTKIIESVIILTQMIRRIGDVSKIPDNSINLDISNTSLINSIYLSNMMINDKNLANIGNCYSSSNINPGNHQNTIDSTKNTYVEIEKFVMQHEDKLFFYDVLFDYMKNFIKQKKVRYTLVREKPQSLGILIENILRDWLKCKKNLDKFAKLKKILEVR